ncbi:MAG: hypothetical protein HY538_05670 [Deltaproteobacteria bacterium]|nr:hypothetical protein [Deltaproteobacteria bacterium]
MGSIPILTKNSVEKIMRLTAVLIIFMTSSVSAQVLYSYTDHLGSTVLQTESSGNVRGLFQYTPFGETLYEQHSTLNDSRFTYTGQELDRESDLYDYGARYYDPILARFTSVDPGWDSLNRYEYARNNPILYTDPNGENPLHFLLKSPDILLASGFALYDSYQSEKAMQEGDLGKALYHSIWAGLDLWTAADFKEPPLLGAVATIGTRATGEMAIRALVESPTGREWITRIYGARAVGELADYLTSLNKDAASEDPTSPSPSEQPFNLEDRANHGKPVTEVLPPEIFPENMLPTNGALHADYVKIFVNAMRRGNFSWGSNPVTLIRTGEGRWVIDGGEEVVVASRIAKVEIPTEHVREYYSAPEFLGDPPMGRAWSEVTWHNPPPE